MQLLKKNMEWFIKNLIRANSTNAQHGVPFCFAGYRIFTDRHIANQLQSGLDE